MKILNPLLISLTMLFSSVGGAANIQSFDQSAFEQTLASGEPVLVDVYATWCPVCKKQEKELTQIVKDSRYDDLVVYKLDFDAQKDALANFKVSQQSTLILYKDNQEVRRSIGETSGKKLQAFLAY